MRGPVTRAAAGLADPQTVVIVRMHDARTGLDVTIGNAATALASPRLTSAEKQAVRNVVASVAYEQTRFGYAGFDDAQHAVVVELRTVDAPSEQNSTIYVPTGNVFAGWKGDVTTGALLTRDAAQHELEHAMQERLTGTQIGQNAHENVAHPLSIDALSVAEGIADAGSLLAMHRWVTGAEFFTSDSPVTDVRDYDTPSNGHSYTSEVVNWHGAVSVPAADPHVEGGVVCAAFRALQRAVGWNAAEDVLWSVLTDPAFAASAQDFHGLADALRRQESLATPTDPALGAAIGAMLVNSGLSDA